MATDARSHLPSEALFYYLLNFERALAWLDARYDDAVLGADERAFLQAFAALPQPSRALLVRMLMRKGTLFRVSRLSYSEIGCALQASAPLVALDWVDAEPCLTLEQLFGLSTCAELQQIFAPLFAAIPGARSLRKPELLNALRVVYGNSAQPFAAWCGYASAYAGTHEAAPDHIADHPDQAHHPDRVLHIAIAPLCERLRLMFFGNLQQDWSEFVLADLGVFQYETVAFAPSSRAFQQRDDVDVYLALHACRDALDALPDDQPVDPLVAALTALDIANPWLDMRRAKLLFRIGQHCERRHDWQAALAVYAGCIWPGARHRRVRVLERSERFDDAFALASKAVAAPESEEEAQRIARMVPRLQRRLGARPVRAGSGNALRQAERRVERSTLVLARPATPCGVEYITRDHLSCADAPVHYVENTLINSLFGLLCWEPVFAALPGAFFHPFQRGPADLHAPDFHARRAAQFAACLAQLDSGAYRETILRHATIKAGLQSPFVFWGMLTPELLTLALDCLPAVHLKRCFERLLRDIRGNRSGLPDLIRFWPAERRYELIEVKGPGDRLQDNQIRWLTYCVEHGMPVRVLDVRWADEESTNNEACAGVAEVAGVAGVVAS